jgi:16S rRNA (guanine966-N2)-methyltransferase
MRIISGKSKGRTVSHDTSGDLRPTSAKVREAIFDILQSTIKGARFLDLFAGSGAVGIESLSRGSAECTFVEENVSRAKKLRDVIEQFDISDKTDVICRDALSFLEHAAERRYDIIFADPPYNYKDLNEIVEIIYNKNIIVKGGIVLIEHSSKRKLPDAVGTMTLAKVYSYGDTAISRYNVVE